MQAPPLMHPDTLRRFRAARREIPHVYVAKGLGGGRRFTAFPSEMDARPWWRKLLALPPK